MSLSNASQLSKLASTLKALHKPGDPLLLANVYDHLSATAVASLPNTKALATASFAVAMASNTKDDDLTLEQNLAAAKIIGAVALKHNLPVSVDFQDGYGSKLASGIEGLLERGVVGINLEDYSREHQRLYSVDENVQRIRDVLTTAKQFGVPDFVVNARCDVLLHKGELDEVMMRGKAYLDAGATTVFVLGGSARVMGTEDIKQMVDAFAGRLNIGLALQSGNGNGNGNGSKIQKMKELGVSRVSIGPGLMKIAMEEYKRAASEVVDGRA